MATKLYVGNLPYSTTANDLKEWFNEFQVVENSPTIIMDRETGRSKGFGFVEVEDAAGAIEKMNGKRIGEEGREREIVVNEARPKEDRPRQFNGGGNSGRGGSSFGGAARGNTGNW